MDTNMSFFPEGYNKIPTNSDYMKFKDGENTFRILSSAVIGYVYWNNEGKPVRSKKAFDHTPADIRTNNKGEVESIKHFWAFAVWNYDESRVQILEITQKQIMTPLKACVDNVRWGDPKMYDITVTRSGTGGFDTEYVVQANPPIGFADPKILEAYIKRGVNLEALFTGADPFNSKPGELKENTTELAKELEAQGKAEIEAEVKKTETPNDEISVEDIPV